jgi:hypothetical protein
MANGMLWCSALIALSMFQVAMGASTEPALALPPQQAAVHQEQAGHSGAPTDALVFLVITMIIGVFTLHLLSFTRVPYTCMLLVR